MTDPADLTQFVGRFHLVLLHLPIGFLVLVALLELVAIIPGLRNASASNGYVLALAVPASLATAAGGWLLAEGGDYDAALLFWHRWLGVATAGLCLVTAVLHRTAWRAGYRLSLLLTVAVLIVASHLGGSITHGRDFLTRHAPGPFRPQSRPEPTTATAAAPAARPVYATVIQPILDRTCVSCHGADKQKGKLRLDSFAETLKGGGDGPAVVADQPADSLLLKRILLPLDDDDHMPPEGKPQPTADEVALLQWWIEAGAPGDATIDSLKPSPDVLRRIEALSTK